VNLDLLTPLYQRTYCTATTFHSVCVLIEEKADLLRMPNFILAASGQETSWPEWPRYLLVRSFLAIPSGCSANPKGHVSLTRNGQSLSCSIAIAGRRALPEKNRSLKESAPPLILPKRRTEEAEGGEEEVYVLRCALGDLIKTWECSTPGNFETRTTRGTPAILRSPRAHRARASWGAMTSRWPQWRVSECSGSSTSSPWPSS
jgi:hypothetical protein